MRALTCLTASLLGAAITLHGAYCGGHGSPSCPRGKRITTEPFEFKMPK